MNLERTLIEVGGEPVGIAVHEGRACRFFASSRAVAKLDKVLFPSPQAAEDACQKLSRPQPRASQAARVPMDEMPTPRGGLPYDFPFMHF
jgi:hypothetical protein